MPGPGDYNYCSGASVTGGRRAGKGGSGGAMAARDAGSGRGSGIMAGFLGPDAKLLAKSGICSVFQLENETGNGIVTIYDAFPGIQLMYNDLHLSRITAHDAFGAVATVAAAATVAATVAAAAAETAAAAVPPANTLVIDHCREGRFECEFPWGECGYMGDGDMVVSALPTPAKSSSYPLAHYHGISIVIDIPDAERPIGEVFSLLGTAGVDAQGIKDRLLASRPYFLVRGSDAVSHIFSELYNAPDALKDIYIRLKLIELFLFLSVIKPDEASGRKYFFKTRIKTVKAMRDYMTAHLDSQFTLGELAERFNIPMTAMKTCFKSVYGMPIHAYMRDYRLQTASAMLRETDEPISEIAAKVGYDSHARFSAAFRASIGVAPSEYRKVAVQNQNVASE
jgi:AraC-like DNA-binding protein